MEYGKIVSVTGLGGLYELISSKSDGAVVRSLEDNTTKFVSTRQHNFSHLESIEVYTNKDNTNLSEVFLAMQNSQDALPDTKNAKEVQAYFEKVYPEMDFTRVYASDTKKMVKWFQIIQKNKIEIPTEAQEEKETQAPKSTKNTHTENAHVKDMKPQQANPRKIESRGVK